MSDPKPPLLDDNNYDDCWSDVDFEAEYADNELVASGGGGATVDDLLDTRNTP